MPSKDRFRFVMPFMRSSATARTISVSSLLLIKTTRPIALDEVRITVGGRAFPARIRPLIGSSSTKKRSHVARLTLALSEADFHEMTIHNRIRACVGEPSYDEEGKPVAPYIERPITYNVLLRPYLAAHGPLLRSSDGSTVAFFRQGRRRSVILTIRHANITDAWPKKMQLYAAWLVSRVAPGRPSTLLFEKNAHKYEESGSVVFERLVDLGYNDVYFVAPHDCLPEEAAPYASRVIEPHTFRHYLAFFRSRNFVGSEVMSHALELRCQNVCVQNKLRDAKVHYVFLQHGVMYMVSLDSPERTSFQRQNLPPRSKVVVSSAAEADHFKELAGFCDDDLIVSGLAKFDRSYQDADADKILIMPTWRPWEFNQARIEPGSTAYARMIDRIVSAIPEDLRAHVVVAPHPLFAQSTFAHTEGGVSSFDGGVSYDQLLRQVKVLITDYSSISFDAFYRGANVLFYWEELDDCMAHYGWPTHLMIDEQTAFGPVCRKPADVAAYVRQAYEQGQSEQAKRRYERIVAFHDGNNTQRIVDAMVEWGMLSKRP